MLQEYGRPTPMRVAAAGLDVSVSEFECLLMRALERISAQVGTESFIEYQRDGFRFVKVAGILALDHSLWIEVVPKFLRLNSPKWREDFLWIAAQTHFGRLFHDFLLPVSVGHDANLFDIIAHTWLVHFERNQRALIRNYVHSQWEDFLIDGEVDEEDLCWPTPEGFRQSGLRFSASNNYNRLLADAARHLRSQVSSPSSFLRLERALNKLDGTVVGQGLRRTSPRIVSRYQRWLPLLELSDFVVHSEAFRYSESGQASLPSFILRTHEAWEMLIRLACKRAHPHESVQKVRFLLGHRQNARRSSGLSVTPDVTISLKQGAAVLVDAKYKTVVDSDAQAISSIVSNSDIYESLAFMAAAKSDSIHLVYPDARDVVENPRVCQPIEVVSVAERRILASSLGVSGISQTYGFQKFSESLRDIIGGLDRKGEVQRQSGAVGKDEGVISVAAESPRNYGSGPR